MIYGKAVAVLLGVSVCVGIAGVTAARGAEAKEIKADFGEGYRWGNCVGLGYKVEMTDTISMSHLQRRKGGEKPVSARRGLTITYTITEAKEGADGTWTLKVTSVYAMKINREAVEQGKLLDEEAEREAVLKGTQDFIVATDKQGCFRGAQAAKPTVKNLGVGATESLTPAGAEKKEGGVTSVFILPGEGEKKSEEPPSDIVTAGEASEENAVKDEPDAHAQKEMKKGIVDFFGRLVLCPIPGDELGSKYWLAERPATARDMLNGKGVQLWSVESISGDEVVLKGESRLVSPDHGVVTRGPVKAAAITTLTQRTTFNKARGVATGGTAKNTLESPSTETVTEVVWKLIERPDKP